MASCFKPICKLCGSMVKRVRKRNRKASKCFEELANKDFDHYEVIDNYYYKLVDSSPRTVSSLFSVVSFCVMTSLGYSYISNTAEVSISQTSYGIKRGVLALSLFMGQDFIFNMVKCFLVVYCHSVDLNISFAFIMPSALW